MKERDRDSDLKALSAKGNYTLIIQVKEKISITMPRLGRISFQKGCYAYTGSALGNGATNLRHRVARHLKKEKKKHWHIDFLLSHGKVSVSHVIIAESRMNRECQVSSLIRNIEGAGVPVDGFGSSDCKQNCGSHLIYFGNRCRLQEIAGIYNRLFGYEPSWISFSAKLKDER